MQNVLLGSPLYIKLIEVAHPTRSHQDLMPILHVARIMVGTFSTDVWHVNNMTLGFGMVQGLVTVGC